MAGITLARRLTERADVVVLEKSHGLGGRMAERRREGFAFDHGAQYFTARNDRFRAVVDEAINAGAVASWPETIARLPAAAPDPRPPELRFVGCPGMPGFVTHLAKGLTIRREAEVQSLQRAGQQWRLISPAGEDLGSFDLVISTAPAPQTARLMPSEFSGHARLGAVRLSGCFTLMLGLRQLAGLELPFDLMRFEHPLLSLLSMSSRKPQRDVALSLVVHSRNDWADAHLEEDREQVKSKMLAALRTLLPLPDEAIAWSDLHRWRYANVEQPAGVPHLHDPMNSLAACGDWCIANRIEAAYLSASSLADALELD